MASAPDRRVFEAWKGNRTVGQAWGTLCSKGMCLEHKTATEKEHQEGKNDCK
jgi:hypothetical protein